MKLLEELITSGRIVDIILAFIVIEILVLLVIRRATGAGFGVVPLLINLGSGGSLMLAFRADLTSAGWQWVGFFLLIALVFHVLDLVLRWQRPASAATARQSGL